MNPVDRVLFKFIGDEKTNESVLIGTILGFSESWPNKIVPPGMVSVIRIETEKATMHIATSEPKSDLEERFCNQLTQIWDKEKS